MLIKVELHHLYQKAMHPLSAAIFRSQYGYRFTTCGIDAEYRGVWLTDGAGFSRLYRVTCRVATWLEMFDLGEEVQPISVHLKP
jgi:hypothetical protein